MLHWEEYIKSLNVSKEMFSISEAHIYANMTSNLFNSFLLINAPQPTLSRNVVKGQGA